MSANDLSPALDPQRSVAVTASAGSGKTWLLVSRIVRLLLSGSAPGSILALTFTRKAAAEMRVRVNERLYGFTVCADDTLDTELQQLGLSADAALRQRARGLYEALLFAPYPLRAQTLHVFCQELLTRFALEAGVPPGFRLVEQEAALRDRAWRSLLAQAHADTNGSAAQALQQLIALGCSENQLEALVQGFFARRADWWAYGEDRGALWPQIDAQLHDTFELDKTPLLPLHGSACAALLQAVHDGLRDCDGLQSLKAERLAPVLAAAPEARYALLLAAVLTQAGEPFKLKSSAKAVKKIGAAAVERLLQDYEHLAAAVRSEHDWRLRRDSAARSAAALRLGDAALQQLQQALHSEGALTFAEVEWAAYRLLRQSEGAEWVRYKLDQRIDHLLIDEFQDTNPTQWRLLLPLLEEMAAGDSGRQRSAFIVGDAKQSIYGFRRAEPALLGAAADWLQRALAAVTVPLDASRRSAPPIIDFVNAVFAAPELQTALDFRVHDTHRRDDWGRIEVAPLLSVADPATGAHDDDEAMRDPLRTPRRLSEASAALQEGRQVAARIRALVASAPLIRGEHGARRLDYGDILVLARQRTHLRAFEYALGEAAIPFIGSSRGTLLETVEARDLIALLRWCDAPHRDLELAQVLKSPLFGASDATLIALASAATDGRSWYAHLRGGTEREDPGLPAADRAAADAARRWLPVWQGAAHQLPAHDLLDRIYSQGDVAARYEAALPPAAAGRVRANLGALIQLALQADSGRYPTLGRFLHFLQTLREQNQDAPDEAPPPSADRQVRVMTVHAAKGLEAPAVFIVNSGSPPAGKSPDWLIDWPAAETRPTLFIANPRGERRDSVSSRYLEQQRCRETREDLNLLYVALTRARQFLHLSGFAPARNTTQYKSWHAQASRALRELTAPADGAALAGVVAGTQVYGQAVATAPSASRDAAPAAVAAAVAAPAISPPAGDGSARLRERCWRRPGTAATLLGASPDQVSDPAATRRGIAIHRLLQWLAAQNERQTPAYRDAVLRERLQAALDRESGATLIEDAEFAEWLAEARAVITAPALRRFFDRSLYQRAWNEMPLHAGADGHGALLGIVDRLVDDGACLWLLDYKTTTADDDEAQLVARHIKQIHSYNDALQRIWQARPMRVGLIVTARRTWLEMPVDSLQ